MAPAERGISVPCIVARASCASTTHAGTSKLCSSRGLHPVSARRRCGRCVASQGSVHANASRDRQRGKTEQVAKKTRLVFARGGQQREKDAAAAVAGRGRGRTARRGDAPRTLVHERQRLQGVHLRGGQGAR